MMPVDHEAVGGGGSSGGWGRDSLANQPYLTPIVRVIGPKGPGGAPGVAGTAGTDTTFGGLVFKGGLGGNGMAPSPIALMARGGLQNPGGVAAEFLAGGDPGERGTLLVPPPTLPGQAITGKGGSSPYGAGGGEVDIPDTPGNVGDGYGAGGSGGFAKFLGQLGGDGSDGVAIVEEWS